MKYQKEKKIKILVFRWIALSSAILILSAGMVHPVPPELEPPAGVNGGTFKQAYENATGLQLVYRAIYDNVRPSVVQIIVESQDNARSPQVYSDPFMNDPFFRKFFGIPESGPQDKKTIQSLGSGFIIDKNGIIVTNKHVVGNAARVKVKLHDGRILDGKVRGTDDLTDIAVIEISDGKQLRAIRIGNSDTLHVGDFTVAVGNPFGLDGTFTSGIVSAVGRVGLDSSGLKFIQTDASINQGNSGGPLLNISGEVIGINRMIVSPTGGSVGIGFAIPINEVSNIIGQIQEKGSVERPMLGISIAPIPQDGNFKGVKGLFVTGVHSGTGAWDAGIVPNDIVISVDGKEMTDPSELVTYVLGKKVGDRIILEILRENKKMKVSVRLGKR